MNFDDSANPNRSISSMPDHSQAPGDFQSFSGDKSSVPQSPSYSLYQKKPNKRTGSITQSVASRSNAYPSYAGNDISEAQQSNYYDRTENENWIQDPYDERGVRDRRLNPASEQQRGSTRGSRMQSNLQASPFGNEEPEPEVDHSYKTFLKLKRLYIYVVFNIVCIFIMGLNIFFAYSTDQTHFTFLEAVDSQFESHLVIDMNLMERSSDCTGLYANTRMGQSSGYQRLCECDTNVNVGECTSHQVAVGCKTTGPLEPVNIALWNSKKICVRRSEGSIKDYYQKLVVNSAGESTCEDDLKKCIVSSNGNAVCMGRFEFCPVTKIIVDEGPSNETAQKKWKGQLHFPNKTFLYENEENKGTSLMDLVVREDECERYQEKAAKSACESEKLLLDRQSEYDAIKDNAQQPEDYAVLKDMKKSIALYGQPANYLEMCRFNKTFNPVILSNELGNWDRVKTLRFVNPFFICSLLIINFVRTSVLDYLNTRTSARVFIKRKKELYNVFGFFTGSSVMITCQVLIILYYIFWGYLLLNQSRLIGQRWLDMSCISGELRDDIQLMMGEISKVEAYNMVTIGPMIVCCILEALFAQYKMIKLEVMDQLRD